MEIKSRARIRPGTLLKYQVPIRTYAEWDERRPGFLETDLVGHDGAEPRESSSGALMPLM